MDHPRFQFRLVTLLGLVACVALNLWLFRLGPLLGILGLNVSKHLLIAYLCQTLGVDRQTADQGPRGVPGPHAKGAVPVAGASAGLPAS